MLALPEDLDTRLAFHSNPEARNPDSYRGAKADDWKLFLEINCNSKQQGLRVEQHIKKMKTSIYIQNLKKYVTP
jgi:putative endonuclease